MALNDTSPPCNKFCLHHDGCPCLHMFPEYLDLPPIRHASVHTSQPCNVYNLLMPRKEDTHSGTTAFILSSWPSAHLRETSTGALRREGRATRRGLASCSRGSHAFVSKRREISAQLSRDEAARSKVDIDCLQRLLSALLLPSAGAISAPNTSSSTHTLKDRKVHKKRYLVKSAHTTSVELGPGRVLESKQNQRIRTRKK